MADWLSRLPLFLPRPLGCKARQGAEAEAEDGGVVGTGCV